MRIYQHEPLTPGAGGSLRPFDSAQGGGGEAGEQASGI